MFAITFHLPAPPTRTDSIQLLWLWDAASLESRTLMVTVSGFSASCLVTNEVGVLSGKAGGTSTTQSLLFNTADPFTFYEWLHWQHDATSPWTYDVFFRHVTNSVNHCVHLVLFSRLTTRTLSTWTWRHRRRTEFWLPERTERAIKPPQNEAQRNEMLLHPLGGTEPARLLDWVTLLDERD